MAGPYGAADPDALVELGSRFILEIDNIQVGAFEKVTLPKQEFAVGTDRTGADDLVKGTYSGLKKESIITFEKHLRVGGLPDIKQILNWAQAGSKDRRSGSVAILNREGSELMRWNFKNGWVSSVGELSLDATSDDIKLPFIFEISVSEIVLD